MSNTSLSAIEHIVEELYLLKCSLLPSETLLFQDSGDGDVWSKWLDVYPGLTTVPDHSHLSAPSFSVILETCPLYIEVQYSISVAIKGDGITRGEQERWQSIIKERMEDVRESDFATYELISTHLLPLLYDEISRRQDSDERARMSHAQLQKGNAASPSTVYHALLTSHHLISPTKRKNLQQWSSQLRISGFAKVGYPGCIYCEGAQEDVEEFVENIKDMQWLALRVRFVEPLPEGLVPSDMNKRRWIELEKVGEVVEEMRRLGRESFVVEMGIGSAGQK